MRTISTKQKLAMGGALVIGLSTSGVAFAYWSSSGSGTGSSSTKTPAASQLEVASYTSPSNMAPGVAAGAITVTVHNKDASSTNASHVVVSISSVDKATGAPAGSCSASDYTLTGADMTTGAADLAPDDSAAGGADQTTFSGASLGFNNTAGNQDGCKGATVNLLFTLS
jgi:hypothetical protein